MDDTITTKYLGREWTIRPLGDEQITALSMMRTGGQSLPLKIIAAVLRRSLGDDVWDELITRMAGGEIHLKYLTGLIQHITDETVRLRKEAAEHAAAPAPETAPVPDTFRG